MTCHNRRDLTLACLDALAANLPIDGISADILLVDDGSEDGTSDAVSQRHPSVRILKGDGSLFWNGGMHMAFGVALNEGFDYYLWLNDDTLLNADAVSRLLHLSKDLSQRGITAIVAGSICDASSGRTTYGGTRQRVKWLPGDRVIHPGSTPQECHTMQGNCVLIPHLVAEKIGNLDPRFIHGAGDVDYGHRARKAGFGIWIPAGHVGTCSRNSPTGTYLDDALPFAERWKHLVGPKGFPPRSRWIYARRHAGSFWFFFWLWPYLRELVTPVLPRKPPPHN